MVVKAQVFMTGSLSVGAFFLSDLAFGRLARTHERIVEMNKGRRTTAEKRRLYPKAASV
jgi:hypothetical protein